MAKFRRFLSQSLAWMLALGLVCSSTMTTFAADGEKVPGNTQYEQQFYNDVVQNDGNTANDMSFGPNAYAEAIATVPSDGSIQGYLYEQFRVWYKTDPAFCAGIALHMDETGFSGKTPLLADFSKYSVDVRAAKATVVFAEDKESFVKCYTAIDALLDGANVELIELGKYTSAQYMVHNGLNGKYPLVVKRESRNTGGHALKIALNGVENLFRMECHGQPIELTYWREVVVPGTTKVVDDGEAVKPQPVKPEPKPEPEPETEKGPEDIDPIVPPNPPVPDPIIDPDPVPTPIPDPVKPDPVDPEPTPGPVDPDPQPVDPDPDPEYTVYLIDDLLKEANEIYEYSGRNSDGTFAFVETPGKWLNTDLVFAVYPNDGNNTKFEIVITHPLPGFEEHWERYWGEMTTDGFEYLEDNNGVRYLVNAHTYEVLLSYMVSGSDTDAPGYAETGSEIHRPEYDDGEDTDDPSLEDVDSDENAGSDNPADEEIEDDSEVGEDDEVVDEPTDTEGEETTDDIPAENPEVDETGNSNEEESAPEETPTESVDDTVAPVEETPTEVEEVAPAADSTRASAPDETPVEKPAPVEVSAPAEASAPVEQSTPTETPAPAPVSEPAPVEAASPKETVAETPTTSTANENSEIAPATDTAAEGEAATE